MVLVRRVLYDFYVVFSAKDRCSLEYNLLLALNFFSYVDDTRSNPLATVSFQVLSGGVDSSYRHAVSKSSILSAPNELPDNYYTTATDSADDISGLFAALHQDFRDPIYDVPSTVGRVLRVLSDLINITHQNKAVIARRETDLRGYFDARQMAEASLVSRGTDLAQSFAEATRLTGEVKNFFDGRQSFQYSLPARDVGIMKAAADLIKVGKYRNVSVIHLSQERFKSSEAIE